MERATVAQMILKTVVGLLLGAVSLTGMDKYWLVDEYLMQFPQQKALSQQFNSIVQKEGEKQNLQQTKPVKIGIVYPGEQVSDYWRRSKVSFMKRMDEIGVKYEVIDYFTKPSLEVPLQLDLINKLIQKNVDYLVFTLDAVRHQKLIEQLLARKKPKVILQNITTPLREWGRNQPFMYVGFDHVIGSKMLADYYIQTSQRKAKYGLLYFTKEGYVSYMRGDQFITALRKKSAFQLMDSYYTDGNRESSHQAAKKLLADHRDLDFIYACSTDVALGALDAIHTSGRKGIRVNGWGGGSAELDAIMKGELDVTVMRMNDDNGVAMAEAIRLDVAGRGGEVPTVYSGSFQLVTKGIAPSELELLKQRAFRYSGR